MIGIGVKLALAGYDSCWDDVDAWLRNALHQGQLRSVGWLEKNYYTSDYYNALVANDKYILKPGQTFEEYLLDKRSDLSFDSAAKRSIGCFGGWVAMNDWYGGYNINAGTDMTGLGIMQCCTGNCARTLYSIYYNMLQYDPDSWTLKINLLINRASEYLDIDSHIPYNGRVDLKIRSSLNLKVRIPSYVDLKEVKLTVNKKQCDISFDNRYLVVGKVKPDDVVKIEFPLKTRTAAVKVRYYEDAFSIQEPYVLTLKGNTVIDISPKGQFYPFYQRDKYISNTTRYIKKERFVPDKLVVW
jgi:hypothetical protein